MLPLFLKPKVNTKLIRVGKKNDGGYLISRKSILNSKFLISIGVSDDWSLELDIKKVNKNIKIEAYDDSLDYYFLIKKFFKNIVLFFSFKTSLDVIFLSFSKLISYPFIKKKINFKKKFISYGDLIDITKNKKNILIKIDIEGNEYRIFDELLQIKKKLVGIIIELHDIDIHKEKIKKFIRGISLNLVHIHPNNYSILDKNNDPTCVEITLEKIIDKYAGNIRLPNSLDQKCNPNKPDYRLRFKR